jgi:hypothetical protein
MPDKLGMEPWYPVPAVLVSLPFMAVYRPARPVNAPALFFTILAKSAAVKLPPVSFVKKLPMLDTGSEPPEAPAAEEPPDVSTPE